MIAMFDSGLGGLSVWRAVRRKLPSWPISFVADQRYCPYGIRTEDEIQNRSLLIGHWLHSQGAKLIVVACNTATSAAIEALRTELPIPIVGIEPAIKPAAIASQTRSIGVLVTQTTLNGKRFRQLLERYAIDVNVMAIPVTGWVECVETGDLNSPKVQKIVEDALLPLQGRNIDHIVLGCTHYPFLSKKISSVLGEHVVLIDPAQAVARQVAKLLCGQSPAKQSGCRFYTSAPNIEDMRRVVPQLIGASADVSCLQL